MDAERVYYTIFRRPVVQGGGKMQATRGTTLRTRRRLATERTADTEQQTACIDMMYDCIDMVFE